MKTDNVHIARMALDQGADAAEDCPDHKVPPVALAADQGSVKVARLFFEGDVNPNWTAHFPDRLNDSPVALGEAHSLQGHRPRPSRYGSAIP